MMHRAWLPVPIRHLNACAVIEARASKALKVSITR